jgi:hypothetical protein
MKSSQIFPRSCGAGEKATCDSLFTTEHRFLMNFDSFLLMKISILDVM